MSSNCYEPRILERYNRKYEDILIIREDDDGVIVIKFKDNSCICLSPRLDISKYGIEPQINIDYYKYEKHLPMTR